MSPIGRVLFVFLLASGAAVSACRAATGADSVAPPAAVDAKEASGATRAAAQALGGGESLTDRKVVRTASLALVVADPGRASSAARAVAERHGGYLVSSTHSGSPERPEEDERVSAVLKVKADQFEPALAELRRLGTSAGDESIQSEDVTEQYVDLDARLRTQRRVEEQYLSLLAQARNVTETLEVHKQLGAVRTEIEQLEGKRRLLEHRVQLSTIQVFFERERPLLTVTVGRLSTAVRRAGADVVNVAGLIVLGGVRALGVLLPLSVLVLLPFALLLRWSIRRYFAPAPRAPAEAPRPEP